MEDISGSAKHRLSLEKVHTFKPRDSKKSLKDMSLDLKLIENSEGSVYSVGKEYEMLTFNQKQEKTNLCSEISQDISESQETKLKYIQRRKSTESTTLSSTTKPNMNNCFSSELISAEAGTYPINIQYNSPTYQQNSSNYFNFFNLRQSQSSNEVSPRANSLASNMWNYLECYQDYYNKEDSDGQRYKNTKNFLEKKTFFSNALNEEKKDEETGIKDYVKNYGCDCELYENKNYLYETNDMDSDETNQKMNEEAEIISKDSLNSENSASNFEKNDKEIKSQNYECSPKILYGFIPCYNPNYYMINKYNTPKGISFIPVIPKLSQFCCRTPQNSCPPNTLKWEEKCETKEATQEKKEEEVKNNQDKTVENNNYCQFIPMFFTNFPKEMNSVPNTKVPKRKSKVFAEREGDWYCQVCKNLNFAFRISCNRCGVQKPADYNKNTNSNN